MGEIQNQITSAIGDFFSNGTVQLVLELLVAYLVVIWFAAAFWAFRDMHIRTEHPVLPYLAASLIIFFSPLFFPFGVVVYRIVRPEGRAADRRERELSEALLLAEIGEIEQCAGCSRVVEPEWMVCPSCRTELRELCSRCGERAEFDWSVCAWCGLDLGRQHDDGARARPRVPVMDEQAAAATGRWPRLSAPRVALAGSSPEPAGRPRRG